MPLTEKGEKIKSAMTEQYGEKGEQVFYASKNKGTITGVDAGPPEVPEYSYKQAGAPGMTLGELQKKNAEYWNGTSGPAVEQKGKMAPLSGDYPVTHYEEGAEKTQVPKIELGKTSVQEIIGSDKVEGP